MYQNRPKNKTLSFESNRIKKNDRHYLFVWKIREMEEIERTPKINQDYKRNFWWSCISILACRYKSKMVFDNVLKICRMEMKNQNIYLKPRSLMILLPYVIRWWIMENLSLSMFSILCLNLSHFGKILVILWYYPNSANYYKVN